MLSLRLYKALARLLKECLLFFTELSPRVLPTYRHLESDMFARLFGTWCKTMNARFCAICRLESPQLRKAHLAASFIVAMKRHRNRTIASPQSHARRQTRNAASANLQETLLCSTLKHYTIYVLATAQTKTVTQKWAQIEWAKASQHCRRRPLSTKNSFVPPFLTLRKLQAPPARSSLALPKVPIPLARGHLRAVLSTRSSTPSTGITNG